MKKQILLIVVCTIFVGLVALSVNAQTNEKRQEIRKNIKEEREEFRQRLQTIRDQKKKLVVEKIDQKIANANKKSTTRFTGVLEKLQLVLDKFSQRAVIIKAKGGNTAQVDEAIKIAQNAIDKAKAQVASQAAKEYTIQIGAESTLRLSVGATVSQFRKDLRDVHKTVIDAKQAVQNVGKEMNLLKAGGVINRDNPATQSSVKE